MEDNTDMCSLSGGGSVVVIGIDAIWRGNVGAVFVLRVQASSGSVPPTSVVSLFFCHFFPSPFFSAIPILLDTTTVPLIPAPCFRSWDFWVFCTGTLSFTLHHDQRHWSGIDEFLPLTSSLLPLCWHHMIFAHFRWSWCPLRLFTQHSRLPSTWLQHLHFCTSTY